MPNLPDRGTRTTTRGPLPSADKHPKCVRCHGYGFEPDAQPLQNCTACGGTGRPGASPATAAQPELAEAVQA